VNPAPTARRRARDLRRPLSNPETSVPRIREAIEAGIIPTIVAVNTLPETALQNTLDRFESEAAAQASRNGNHTEWVAEWLAPYHEQFGDQANLVVIDDQAA